MVPNINLCATIAPTPRISANLVWQLALLVLEVPCAIPMCQSVVRLADGTTLNNSIVVDHFVQLRKQIPVLVFFSPVRTYKDANGGYSM